MKRYNEGDVFSALRRPPNSVTGAATAQVDSLNICSGTTYTLSLPAASAHQGKMLGVLITATGRVTLGTISRVMWLNESALLVSDGTNWLKFAGKSRPMRARFGLSAPQSGFTSSAHIQVAFDRADIDNTGLMCDTGNSQIVIKRAGDYILAGKVVWANIAPANRCIATIFQTNTSGTQLGSSEQQANNTTGFNGTPDAIDQVALADGDIVLLAGYQTTGGSVSVYGAAGNGGCRLMAEEVDPW